MNDVILKRYCSAGHHEVIDDGKGAMKPMGNNGQKRWQCSTCMSNQKNRTFIKTIHKNKAGRKPKPKEDYSICDPIEDREFIRKEFGI